MSNISEVEPQRGNNKKRKFIEMSENKDEDVEILTRKILKISFNKKRKDKETLENIPKFRKLERCSQLPKEYVYICYTHDHNRDNCSLYECDGVKHKNIEEDLRKYYIY